MKIELSPLLLGSIASGYTDVNRVIIEYIDNSLDSAEELYNRETKKYNKEVLIEMQIEGTSSRNGKVTIYDNCTGINDLEGVCRRIGNSDKKAQPWTNGQFGAGMFSYIAACNNLKITSKVINEAAYFIDLPKENFNKERVEDVELNNKEKCGFLYESGTKIELSSFEKDKWNSIDFETIKSEIEIHFEHLLKRRNLKIVLKHNNLVYICKCFNYESIEGIELNETIDKLSGKSRGQSFLYELKENPIKIFLKLSKKQQLNRFPVFVKSGRRIDFVKNVKSFYKLSKNRSVIWNNPKITGYIDVGNFLSTTIHRQDFKNTPKSKALFEKLILIEDEILKSLTNLNEEQNEKNYNNLENHLNEALSKLARIDNINFRNEISRVGKENLPNKEDEENKSTENRPLPDDIIFAEESLKCPQCKKNGIETEMPKGQKECSVCGYKRIDQKTNKKDEDYGFLDNDLVGKKRRKPGMPIKLANREPDEILINDKLKKLRSVEIAGSIEIFTKHPDFESRLDKRRNGESVISQRLITYLAGEITVHYKDTFYEKNKINIEYSKKHLEELVDFIYQLEDSLKYLRNQDMSKLSSM